MHRNGHGHILRVGFSAGGAVAVDHLSRGAARARLRLRRDSFYVLEDDHEAEVRPFECPACHVDTLRSDADGTTANNLGT